MMKKFIGFAVGASIALQSFAFPALPQGSTGPVAITASAQTISLPTAPTISPTGPIGSVYSSDALAMTDSFGLLQYVVTTSGTQLVVCTTDGSTTATTGATTGNPFHFLANSQVVISIPATVRSVSCIAAATGTTIYLDVVVGQ